MSTVLIHNLGIIIDVLLYGSGVGYAIWKFRFNSSELKQCVPYNTGYKLFFALSALVLISRFVFFTTSASKDGKSSYELLMKNGSDLNINYENVIVSSMAMSFILSCIPMILVWTYEYNKTACNKNYSTGVVFFLLFLMKIWLSFTEFIIFNYSKTDDNVLISRII